jgi:hypothetical protein
MRATARGLSVYSSTGGMHETARGLGDDCIAESSDGSSVVVPCGDDSSLGSGGSGTSNTDWSQTIANIGTSFANIFKAIQPIPAGCSMVQTAQGSSVQCLSTLQQQQGTSSFTSLLGSGSSSTILLLVAGVAAIMILKK